MDLKISGMTCGNCVKHVTSALQEAGADDVVVVLESGRASVADGADVEALVAAVREAGYEATIDRADPR